MVRFIAEWKWILQKDMMALCFLETRCLLLCMRSLMNITTFLRLLRKDYIVIFYQESVASWMHWAKRVFFSRIILLGRTSLLRQKPHRALEQGDIRDRVIPEDTDRLRSLLCFQHGVLHYDGLFHQVGRKLPVTVNGCAYYRCVNNRAIWQSAEGEKLHSDLNIKMQSTFWEGLQLKDFHLLPFRKHNR